ncbi:MAG: glucose-6-phosphate isomerase [Halobacteriales archaeon]
MELDVDLSGVDVDAVEDGLTEDDRLRVDEDLQEVAAWFDDERPAFARLPEDVDVDGVQEVAGELREEFDSYVNVGIGGSSLGGATLCDALAPDSDVYFVDNADPDLLDDVLSAVDLDRTVFAAVSKSGSTAETLANYRVVRDVLESEGFDASDRFVAITDSDAFDARWTVEFPDVPGRYSALSVVGLLPAAFAGVDVEAVVEGGRRAAERCRRPSLDDNPGFAVGAVSHVLRERGYDVSVMMPYSERLERFAEWYAQLWSESLGKRRDGVGYGQTPVRALGTTDQHSLLQLLVDGPRDKLVTFVDRPPSRDYDVPGDDYLGGTSLDGLRRAELEATRRSLAENDVPTLSVEVDGTPESTGGLLYVYEVAVVTAARLAGVNPFDQPGVEDGKRYARELLERGGVGTR